MAVEFTLPDIGSVVSLKSGGPKMVVNGFSDVAHQVGALAHTVECVWHDETGVLQRHSFGLQVLDLPEPVREEPVAEVEHQPEPDYRSDAGKSGLAFRPAHEDA